MQFALNIPLPYIFIELVFFEKDNHTTYDNFCDIILIPFINF